jgi:hypothetical protein
MLENYWNTDYVYNQSHRNHFDYVGQDSLAKHLAFVHDNSLKINQMDASHDAELIYKCHHQTGRMPVLCLDSNPYDVETYLTELEKHIDSKNFFVFNPDIREEHSVRSNLAPWPSWLINQQLHENMQVDRNKTHRISFLSGVPRYHRIYLFRQIRPWVKDSDVVVINCFRQSQFANTVPRELTTNVQHWLNDLPWSNKVEYIDTEQSCSVANEQALNKHPAYSACINITGETLGYGTQVLPSEKTWKAYRSGCLVVNYGIQDMPTALENLGIKIWKEYDTAQPPELKCEKIVELFQRDDVEDLYHQQRYMIDYNQNLVNSMNFVKKLAQPAVEKLQIHLETV